MIKDEKVTMIAEDLFRSEDGVAFEIIKEEIAQWSEVKIDQYLYRNLDFDAVINNDEDYESND